MKAFKMEPAPRIICGEGEVYHLADFLKNAGASRALIIYDQGVSSLVTDILTHMGDFPFETFDDIVPESPDYIVEKLRNKAQETAADAFIAIGGGSTIDTARAAMLLSGTDEPVNKFFEQPYHGIIKDTVFICIPTTAGTGAEMSAAGPILNTEKNTKKGLLLPGRQPDTVILDPVMTATLPPFVAYCCAMDALAHSIEAMTGNRRNAMTEMICGQAVEYIWKYLPRVMHDPGDTDARAHLLLASNMAIGCQNIRHLGHAVCQPVGAKLHLSHGYSCAAVLPAMLTVLSEAKEIQEPLTHVAKRMGFAEQKYPGKIIADEIRQLHSTYGIPTLEAKGVAFSDMLSCTDEILKDQRLLPNCPVKVTQQLVENVLVHMYHGC